MSTLETPAPIRGARIPLAVIAAVGVAAGLYLGLGPFWKWAIYSLAGLPRGTHWSDAMHFFFFDTTKILLLLVGIIFVVRILRSFLSIERTRALLGGKREGIGNVLAACLGVATPFCSCSAVPAFIGFVAAGVPLGVTLSFLIASPLVNEVAVVLLYGMFGFEVAAGPRLGMRQLRPARRPHQSGTRRPRPQRAGREGHRLRGDGRPRRHGHARPRGGRPGRHRRAHPAARCAQGHARRPARGRMRFKPSCRPR